MACNCRKQPEPTPPPIPVEVQEHFIKELDEYKSPISEPTIDEIENNEYPLIED